MPYKDRLTTVDILLSLRDSLMRARADKQEDTLLKLQSIVDYLLDLAYLKGDRGQARILEQIADSTRDSLMGVPGKSEIPSADAIRGLAPSTAGEPAISASIIRRAHLSEARRPTNFGYTPDKTGEYSAIDPAWLAVATANGPYRDTFDLLCYGSDGTLLTFYEFDHLQGALDFAAQKSGIQAGEWEVCDIRLTDPDGRPNWLANR
jgi:hypothetical protein